MNARDKLARFLPGWLLDHPEVKEKFGSFANDAYRAPSNVSEAAAFQMLGEIGCTVLRRGWPDFLVFGGPDDIFCVEIKGSGDIVRPSQRVVLETLASKGIDVYIFGGQFTDAGWSFVETVGDSKPWTERYAAFGK